MVSSIRDPLDRLVTRREAHAIAVKVLEQMLGAMAKAQQEYDGPAVATEPPGDGLFIPPSGDDMAARVRAGG